MTEFEDVLATNRHASAYWQNRFAQFYLKHKDYENAITYFNTRLSKNPESNLDVEIKNRLKEAKMQQ